MTGQTRSDNPRNLTRRIVDVLGREIVTGRYTVEHPFPVEAELCVRFSASRPIVREAVKMLTAKSLLRARQRSGTAVLPEDGWNLLDPDVLRWMLERPFALDLLIDFTQMRLAIEPCAAALAARQATPAQLAQIGAAIARMYAAERGEDDPLEADIGFHTAILAASGNRFMRQFTGLSETTLRFSILRTNAQKGVVRASAEEHDCVAQAILAGDAEFAARAMSELIKGALDLLLVADAGS